MKKMTIDDVDLRGKRVLLRVDFNVPMSGGAVADVTRIAESLPTIRKIAGDGGRAVIMSHLGRPKGKKNAEFTLRPVAERLAGMIRSKVDFADDCIGDAAAAAVARLKDGECLVLENLRFYAEEEANDPAFARQLAAHGDLYVNDAFGTAHRAHASTEGVTHFLSPAVAGYLMKKEIDYLSRAVANPERPYVAILGGAKISGKIEVIEHLLGIVDALLIGGGMMFTFLKALGMETGTSLLEADKVELAGKILEDAKRRGIRLVLPVDCVAADALSATAQRATVPVSAIPPAWKGLDIGPETVRLFGEVLKPARTVVWNGPMGVFEMEPFAAGTLAIARMLADITKGGAVTIVGGGDSAAAVARAGVEKSVSHVSTGGGASLEFLEGKTLPGLAALTDR
jgi:phosphoglycerate kinase